MDRGEYQTPGVAHNLPVFYQRMAERLTYPLSWTSGTYTDYDDWRDRARARVMQCLLAAPPSAPFDAEILGERNMGGYVSRKVVFNVSGDSRVLAYLNVPKGTGPYPAVLLLHDHGARFDIGKEKVIRPWDVGEERMASSLEWVNDCYGGRYLGEELARRGYVCLSTDALNWSDRGGASFEQQQALSCTLLHLGSSLAGTIAHEDLRTAEFLAGQPVVDATRIGAMGLSMGSFRTWQLAALSDHIAAGVAICWMCTNRDVMVPGNNQTTSPSAYTMTHPGLTNWLDHPDVASLACPKPMLFYNGLRDGLFPVPSVKEAYAKMRSVWQSQGAEDRLETRLWDVPHEFNAQMQKDAFDWLDRYLLPAR